MFHRRFTDKRIAVTSLRRLYLRHGVKRKKVRQEKAMPARSRNQFVQNCKNLLATLAAVRQEGRRILYLDEINFTKRSVLMREWSGKNTNLAVDQEDIYVGYRAAIAAMSAKRGMEYVSYQDQAVNAEDFIQYVRELRAS